MTYPTVETRVAGIPCLAKVLTYKVTPPWRGSSHTCPSDVDWHGYTECEYEVCDQRGRPAPWLERKLTDDDRQRIECDIAEKLGGN